MLKIAFKSEFFVNVNSLTHHQYQSSRILMRDFSQSEGCQSLVMAALAQQLRFAKVMSLSIKVKCLLKMDHSISLLANAEIVILQNCKITNLPKVKFEIRAVKTVQFEQSSQKSFIQRIFFFNVTFPILYYSAQHRKHKSPLCGLEFFLEKVKSQVAAANNNYIKVNADGFIWTKRASFCIFKLGTT